MQAALQGLDLKENKSRLKRKGGRKKKSERGADEDGGVDGVSKSASEQTSVELSESVESKIEAGAHDEVQKLHVTHSLLRMLLISAWRQNPWDLVEI